MAKKKKKYLTDTSAVPVALGESTRAHCDHFRNAVADGTCWTSTYIRKEFVRRWIHYYIKMAFNVDHFSDMASAIYHLEQDFGIRDVKTGNHAIGVILQHKGRIDNTRTMAKELARLAVGELRKFDRRFRKRIPNSCGCRIGGKDLKVDFNHFFEDLRKFIASIETVNDCPINSFLNLGGFGRATQLLDDPDVVKKTKSGKNLDKFRTAKKRITCTQCRTIGDAVIVLEQPPSWCLVHIDRDFNILCSAAKRQNMQLKSERAVEKDAPKLR